MICKFQGPCEAFGCTWPECGNDQSGEVPEVKDAMSLKPGASTSPDPTPSDDLVEWICQKCWSKKNNSYAVWACVKGGYCVQSAPPTFSDLHVETLGIG